MQVNFSQYRWLNLTIPQITQALDLAGIHPPNRSRMRKDELIRLLVDAYNRQPPAQVTPHVGNILRQGGYPGPINIFSGEVPRTPTVRSRAAQQTRASQNPPTRGEIPYVPLSQAPSRPRTPPPAPAPAIPPAPTRPPPTSRIQPAAEAAPVVPPSPRANRSPSREQAEPRRSPPRVSRIGLANPPCQFVPTGPCAEGYSFIELEVPPESIPEDRRVFLKVGNRTICLDALELQEYFNRAPGAQRQILDTGYGTCEYSSAQRHQIEQIAHRNAPAPPTLTLAPLPILAPVNLPAPPAPVAPRPRTPPRQAPAPQGQGPIPEVLPQVEPVNVPASETLPTSPVSRARRSRSPPRRSPPSERTLQPQDLSSMTIPQLTELSNSIRSELYRRAQRP